MSAFVRIVDHAVFARQFDRPGTQTSVAAYAGITLARVNQLVRGVSLVVPARTGEAIEAALGLRTGTLFQPDDADVLRRFLAHEPELCTVHTGHPDLTAALPDSPGAD